MSAAVMRRDDLEVFDLPAPIPVLVLDAYIRKLDVLVFVWQSVRQRPLPNLVAGAIGSAVAVAFPAIALLEEALVFALQLVVEDHAADMTTALPDLLCRSFVRTVEVRVMRDLGPPGKARIEALAVIERTVLSCIQKVATAVCEGHERGARTSCAERTRFDEARTPQVLDLPVAISACTIGGWLQLALRHGPKRANRRQQPNVGSGQLVRALADRDTLSASAARQCEPPGEHITRITR
jgi:hypothetical protein